MAWYPHDRNNRCDCMETFYLCDGCDREVHRLAMFRSLRSFVCGREVKTGKFGIKTADMGQITTTKIINYCLLSRGQDHYL